MSEKMGSRTAPSYLFRGAALAMVLLLPRIGLAQPLITYKIARGGGPCVKLRSAPKANAEAIDCLAPEIGTVEIESKPFWRKVRVGDGREGWIAKKFLEPAAIPAPAVLPSEIPSDAWVEVHFVDVGQGDGVWIHTYDDGIDKNTQKTLKSIEKLRLPELQARFAEIVGEASRSPNRKFLLRRIGEALESRGKDGATEAPKKEPKGKGRRRADKPAPTPDAAPEVANDAAPPAETAAAEAPRPRGRFAAMSVEELQAK